jgi:microtubule-associated protein, RP/EB family
VHGHVRWQVEGLEKERDFYFGKLRDIEILLQAYTGTDQTLSKQIFDILYATEEDFVVAEEGEKENLS